MKIFHVYCFALSKERMTALETVDNIKIPDAANNPETGSEYAIELRHITKRFGSVVANNDITLSLRKGEILSARRKRQRKNHTDEYARRHLLP